MDESDNSLLNICLRNYCLILKDKVSKCKSSKLKSIIKSYNYLPLDLIHMIYKTAKNMYIIDDSFAPFIIPSVKYFSELIIPKCKISSIGLNAIIEQCTTLKKLDLSYCDCIDDIGFSNITRM